MITGVVDCSQAIVQLTIVGNQDLTYEFAVDTGFTDEMTLPPNQIAALGLTWSNFQIIVLADGSRSVIEQYEAVVKWNGSERLVLIGAMDSEPLIGMNLLHGHRLTIDIVHGGAVTIESLTTP